MQSQDTRKYRLPDAPGVYFFKSGRKIHYIGKATSLKDRVKSYFSKDLIVTRGPLIVDMVFKADKIDFIKTNSVLEALILENNLIKKHKPYYNTKEKDDRSYYYVVITKEKFPRVLIVRGKELQIPAGESGAFIYPIKTKFGPYPNAGQLKTSLEIIRKIFPYHDKCEPGQTKPCFNYQIGLCPGVCIGAISEKDYKKRIKNIELFLNSKTSILIKGLEKEMKLLAREQKFEQAQKIRNTIFALNHIRDVALIKEDVSLSSSEESKLKVLGFPPFADVVSARHFNLDSPDSLQGTQVRIEAYDAAHLAGTNNVGVMVVMEDGELKRSDYRKFKIKESKGSDVDALREILTRRFNHPEWTKPYFIVIDGGIAQINTAKNTLKQLNHKIPIIAVTKDDHHKAKALTGDENLIRKYKKQILLINNEAHRFAIKYHRELRSKI